MHDTGHKDEVFSLKVNEEGKAYLQRYIKLLWVFVFIGWLYSILLISRDVFLLSLDYSLYEDNFPGIYYRLYPIFSLVANFVFIIELVYSRRIAKRLQYAITNSDETMFSSGIRDFVLCIRWTITSFVISLFMIAADFYISMFY